MYMGVPPPQLSGDALLREITHLHETRVETLMHGSDHALENHTRRIVELESEYLRRFPERHVIPDRLREGARARGS